MRDALDHFLNPISIFGALRNIQQNSNASLKCLSSYYQRCNKEGDQSLSEEENFALSDIIANTIEQPLSDTAISSGLLMVLLMFYFPNTGSIPILMMNSLFASKNRYIDIGHIFTSVSGRRNLRNLTKLDELTKQKLAYNLGQFANRLGYPSETISEKRQSHKSAIGKRKPLAMISYPETLTRASKTTGFA